MTRLMALDPGTRRIGIAVSNSGQTMAFPRECIIRDGDWLDTLTSLVREEDVHEILVGRPVALSGRETTSTAMAEEFLEEIRDCMPDVTFHLVDERLTTTSAAKQMALAGKSQKSQRKVIDSAAAVVLLQGVLDANQ
ncbi:MAG: Holliday junction resolvase RuvX [Actinobacteria bacterium]|nr:Holliday junction resolvase RuvX [Actinomycetota bacterium]